jgi:hypothetical protein
MIKLRTFAVPESVTQPSTSDRHVAATLAAAIRKPLETLDAAAEEAANGMLGRAKLGLLIAANDLRDALDAVDAEFARQYAACTAGRRPRQADRRGSDRKSL